MKIKELLNSNKVALMVNSLKLSSLFQSPTVLEILKEYIRGKGLKQLEL